MKRLDRGVGALVAIWGKPELEAQGNATALFPRTNYGWDRGRAQSKSAPPIAFSPSIHSSLVLLLPLLVASSRSPVKTRTLGPNTKRSTVPSLAGFLVSQLVSCILVCLLGQSSAKFVCRVVWAVILCYSTTRQPQTCAGSHTPETLYDRLLPPPRADYLGQTSDGRRSRDGETWKSLSPI